MKNISLISAALVASVQSVQWGRSASELPEQIQRYQSQEQCDQLPSIERFYSYTFNQDACACFLEFNFAVDFCGSSSVHNPLHTPFQRDLCITQEDYDSIFDHDLNENCQRELDVIAFNTLLFPAAIELTPGRLEAATDMIVDADADVLCLQEVFLPDEIDYV